jgi:hypothetical protein
MEVQLIGAGVIGAVYGIQGNRPGRARDLRVSRKRGSGAP